MADFDDFETFTDFQAPNVFFFFFPSFQKKKKKKTKKKKNKNKKSLFTFQKFFNFRIE